MTFTVCIQNLSGHEDLPPSPFTLRDETHVSIKALVKALAAALLKEQVNLLITSD